MAEEHSKVIDLLEREATEETLGVGQRIFASIKLS